MVCEGASRAVSELFNLERKMTTVAKSIEISAESNESFDHAVREGIRKAQTSVDNLQSVWIENQQVTIGRDGNPETFRVWMKATFILN